MAKRTTVILEDDVYEALVRESLKEHGTAKAMSKVLNDLLKRTISNRARLWVLVRSKKVAHTNAKEMEAFRSKLSGAASK